jgi:hypothetical protein
LRSFSAVMMLPRCGPRGMPAAMKVCVSRRTRRQSL